MLSIFETMESEVRSYCRNWTAVFDRADGSRVCDEDGNEYLDFFCGAGALNYGHNHPVLRRALIEHLERGSIVHSLDMHTVAKRDFLERFRSHVLEPRGLDYKVMFPGPTGTNSVEAALKLARKVTGREHVVSFTNAFHGMTLGSLAVTGNSMKRGGAGIPLYHATPAPYDDYFDGETTDFLWLERVLNDRGSGIEHPAAVIVETVQGEGGLNTARATWLQGLQDLCRRHDILLIVDDVQAGCGRTGTFFSFEPAGLEPDIVCLSKSLSGYGLPFALTLFRPEHDLWEPGEHNGTFRGHNPAFVTATAALETFWADGAFAEGVRQRAAELRQGLDAIASRHDDVEVRGRGMLQGIAFADPAVAGKATTAAFERGLLVETSGPEGEVVKVMPPLNIEPALLSAGLDVLDAAIEAVR